MTGDKAEPTAKDRAEGVLLGLAAGDRNGGPIRMALGVAESLRDCAEFDVGDIAARHLNWWHEGAFDTGLTAARVFTLVDSGLSFPEAARRVHVETGGKTAGCNPAHRSTPLAMMADLHSEDLADFARSEAELTHYHPLSGDVAAAVVVLCSQLVRGAAWEEAVVSARERRRPKTQGALLRSRLNRLNPGGFAPDVLAATVHFVGSNQTFCGALSASLRFAGAANFCPVLVGSIGGARWGASNIPRRMLDHCDLLARARSTAASLASQRVERLARGPAVCPPVPLLVTDERSGVDEPAAPSRQHPRNTPPEKSTETGVFECIPDFMSVVKPSP